MRLPERDEMLVSVVVIRPERVAILPVAVARLVVSVEIFAV